MSKKKVGLGLIALLGFLHANVASAAILSLDPASTTVAQSTTFDVDVVISDLAGQLVGGFDVTLGYDPSLLAVTNIAFSGNLGIPDFDTFTISDSTTPGSAFAFEVSFLPGVDLAALQPGDSVLLATLSFLAVNAGSASIDINFPIISDELAMEIGLQSIEGARVDVSAVPLPGALWLMVSALLGIGAMTRKHRTGR